MSFYSVNVNTDDVSGIVSMLPASMRGPFGDAVFSPNVDDVTTGVLQVSAVNQAALDAAVATSSAARNQAMLTTYAASQRWTLQTGGIMVGTTAVATDADSVALINGAVSLLNNDSALTDIEFKSSQGWVDLTRAQMLAVGVAVGTFYQQCFSAERSIDAKIASGTYTATTQIDTAAEWPATIFQAPAAAPAAAS